MNQHPFLDRILDGDTMQECAVCGEPWPSQQLDTGLCPECVCSHPAEQVTTVAEGHGWHTMIVSYCHACDREIGSHHASEDND